VPAVNAGAAQTWFIAGTIPILLAGGLHVLGALVDTVRPTFFAPIGGSAKPVVEGTGVRLVQMLGLSGARPSMWRMWLGIHISHGLGVFTFGLICLLIAAQDYELVGRIDGLRPLTIAFPAAYFVLALRFWFYGPVLVTAASTACFTIAAVLSA
jgi:hypothetical protein